MVVKEGGARDQKLDPQCHAAGRRSRPSKQPPAAARAKGHVEPAASRRRCAGATAEARRRLCFRSAHVTASHVMCSARDNASSGCRKAKGALLYPDYSTLC